MTKYLIGLAVLLTIALTFSVKTCKDNKAEADRQSENLEQITWDHNRELTLTKYEYSKLRGEFKDKIDSVIKANKIKPNQVKQATVINTAYTDTSKTPAITGKPVIQNQTDIATIQDPIYMVSVGYFSSCWSMKGEILSIDPNPKLNITEKSATNSMQLIVVLPKKFLGFLWITKKGEAKAFSDCGTVKFTKIDFIKK